MIIAKHILKVLPGFEAISLEEIEKASLMRRKDSKYIFSVEHLPLLLEKASKYYRILEIENKRTHNYQTIYFDTPGMDMYHMHHRGIVNRYKIRFRKYENSDSMFLEVKEKDARGVTIKNRMQTGNGKAFILSGEEEFLSMFTPYQDRKVIPVLENNFNRITLVSADQSERITLDYHLWFSNPITDQTIEIPGISIAEIKYGSQLTGSRFHAALRSQKIVSRRFSKYCFGLALLNPGLKQNLFKEKIRYVNKINNYYLQSI
ncbi:MAG: polyphosphate polymerase domain-containing protein [Bacteroidota bacterium]